MSVCWENLETRQQKLLLSEQNEGILNNFKAAERKTHIVYVACNHFAEN